MTFWTRCETSLPPDNRVVMTMIDDGNGKRNEQPLKRRGNLWFVPDESMYVYYSPTHWREMTAEERASLVARLQERVKFDRERYETLIGDLQA